MYKNLLKDVRRRNKTYAPFIVFKPNTPTSTFQIVTTIIGEVPE